MSSAVDPSDLVPIVVEYRKALEECGQLYESCAQECLHTNLNLSGETEDEFLQRMVDLGHGLMLKIFLSIAGLDGQWSHEDLLLAVELIEYVWGKRLKPKQLRETLDHCRRQGGP